MKIQVTDEHIRKGHRADPKNDPVALALKDAGFGDVYVGVNEIRVRKIPFTGIWVSAPVPKLAFEFMLAFDNGQTVDPIEFELVL